MSVERICKNCKLYNPETSRCSVLILHAGQKYNLPVDELDSCFFEDQFTAIKPKFDSTGNLKAFEEETFTPEIKEVKWWVEDPATGETTNGDGVVKIEYPEGFFGEENE